MRYVLFSRSETIWERFSELIQIDEDGIDGWVPRNYLDKCSDAEDTDDEESNEDDLWGAIMGNK